MVDPLTGALDLWTGYGELLVHITDDAVQVYGPRTVPGSGRPVGPSPPAIRDWCRTDDRGRYRPLPSARSLPSNWESSFPTLDAFSAALGEVYPLAEEHIAAYTDGSLRVVGLDDVLERQSGRYRVAAELDERGRSAAADVLCARCVKVPVWRTGRPPGPPPGDNPIPCPEPCSVMVSLCREAALWQQEPPEPTAIDPDVAFAAFEEPGNEVREAYLRHRYGDAHA
ncbi:MAG: DR2241 family protein [Hyphomicrobiales bacterium]